MDLLDILRACLRRWYVFVPVLVLTVWLAVGQYAAALPQYTATTSVLVVPSRELIVARGVQSTGGDPVTTPFNGSSAPASLAGMLRTALNTTTVREQLLPDGGVALAATRDPEEDSALVMISIVSNNEEQSRAAVEAVNTGVNGVLAAIQTGAGAPGNQLYATVLGGPVDRPVEDYPDRLRAVVGISLAGTLFAVLLSVLVQAAARDHSTRVSDRRRLVRAQGPGPRLPSGQGAARPEVDLRDRRTGART